MWIKISILIIFSVIETIILSCLMMSCNNDSDSKKLSDKEQIEYIKIWMERHNKNRKR